MGGMVVMGIGGLVRGGRGVVAGVLGFKEWGWGGEE